MTRTITFQVLAADFDREAYTAITAAREHLDKLQNDLIRKFRASDRFKAAKDVAGYGNSFNKSAPSVAISGGYVTVTLYADEGSDKPSLPSHPPMRLDPKLVNTLLHGKILSDEEKRALVMRLAPGVITAAQGEKA